MLFSPNKREAYEKVVSMEETVIGSLFKIVIYTGDPIEFGSVSSVKASLSREDRFIS